MLTINLEKNNKEDRLLFPLGGLVLHFTAFFLQTISPTFVIWLTNQKIRFIYLRFADGYSSLLHSGTCCLLLLGMETLVFVYHKTIS